jgi:transposase
MTVADAVDTAVFRTYVKQVLGPTLVAGDIVVMDHLLVDKAVGMAEAIASRGARLEFLPTYSPDLNPIEQCWAKIKTALRQAQARTRPALEVALKQALRTITPQRRCAGLVCPLWLFCIRIGNVLLVVHQNLRVLLVTHAKIFVVLVIIPAGSRVVGANARYLRSGWLASRFGATFPYGTYVINVLIVSFSASSSLSPRTEPGSRLHSDCYSRLALLATI